MILPGLPVSLADIAEGREDGVEARGREGFLAFPNLACPGSGPYTAGGESMLPMSRTHHQGLHPSPEQSCWGTDEFTAARCDCEKQWV